jgi:hypothetical protein
LHNVKWTERIIFVSYEVRSKETVKNGRGLSIIQATYILRSTVRFRRSKDSAEFREAFEARAARCIFMK